MQRTTMTTSALKVGEGMNSTLLAQHFCISNITRIKRIHEHTGRASKPSHGVIVSRGAFDGQHPANILQPTKKDISSGNNAH
jgi:hypothetical protein